MVKNTKWLRMLAICLCALLVLGSPLGSAGMSETLNEGEEGRSVSTPEHLAEPGTEAILDSD